MTDEKITYEDLKGYESLFTMVPSFLFSGMVKRNTNLVKKFHSQVISYLKKLNDNQKQKLKIILNSDIAQLQQVMGEAHKKTGKKQYKLLADPNNKDFIVLNLNELKKLVDY